MQQISDLTSHGMSHVNQTNVWSFWSGSSLSQ